MRVIFASPLTEDGMYGEITLKHLHVTCAIIERGGMVLAAQRGEGDGMQFKWEFPGGKIDPGETAEEGLRRELREELDIEVRVLRRLSSSTHDYPSFRITLHPFVCFIEAGEPALHAHAAIVWKAPDELRLLDWAGADIPVIEMYLEGLRDDCRLPAARPDPRKL